MHRTVVVAESVHGRWRDREGPHQERCHLAAGDNRIRAEMAVGITALGDPDGGDRLDVTLRSHAVVVLERASGRQFVAAAAAPMGPPRGDRE